MLCKRVQGVINNYSPKSGYSIKYHIAFSFVSEVTSGNNKTQQIVLDFASNAKYLQIKAHSVHQIIKNLSILICRKNATQESEKNLVR